MDEPQDIKQEQDIKKDKEYSTFALPRMIAACAVIILLVWALAVGLGYLDRPEIDMDGAAPGPDTTASHKKAPSAGEHAAIAPEAGSAHMENAGNAVEHSADAGKQPSGTHAEINADTSLSQKPSDQTAHTPTQTKAKGAASKTPPQGETHDPEQIHKPTGVAFVEAMIEPIEHELKVRFWGWRPNDIINITDNVNNYQLGILEVTRRTAVQLAERISRTGSTDSFDPHLENAMNWFMVKADRYWFPSPESKYKEALDELSAYKEALMNKKASFYTRTDNLIPLLAVFEDLMGSCDENLVKAKESDGTDISYFKVDDYFYYAKGVASAMATILEAVHHDFEPTLEGRHGTELLHHAILSCRRAAELEPWLITDGDLDGVFANHRANMAAPISHARFYLGQLVKTLST